MCLSIGSRYVNCSVLSNILVLGVLVVGAFACSPAHAQVTNYTLSVSDTSIAPGETGTVSVSLAIPTGVLPIRAAAVGVCSDPSAVAPVTIDPGLGVVDAIFFEAQLYAEGGVFAMITDFFGVTTLGSGDHELATIDYTATGAHDAVVVVCDSLDTPALPVMIVQSDLNEVDPSLLEGSISVNGVSGPGEFVFQVQSRTTLYDPITGVAEFPVTLAADQTEGLTTIEAMTFAFTYDASLCTAVGAAPRASLQHLNGGAGPEFFGVDLVAGGVAVSIDVGDGALALTYMEPLATVFFSANATAVLTAGTTTTPLTFSSVEVSGTPVANSITTGEGVDALAFTNGSITFVPDSNAGVVAATLVVGEAATSTEEASVPVSMSAGTNLEGLQYAVCHDMAVLAVQDVVVGRDLLVADEAGLLAFVGFDVEPEGWESGLGLEFTGSSILATGNSELAVATYEVLDSSVGTTAIDICSPGGPLLDTAAVVGGMVVPVASVGGTLRFVPTTTAAGDRPFRRGDVDASGSVTGLTDALFLLTWGFFFGPTPPCEKAADVNDNGLVEPLNDALFLLNFQFLGGASPPAPGIDCGEDATVDALSCFGGQCG